MSKRRGAERADEVAQSYRKFGGTAPDPKTFLDECQHRHGQAEHSANNQRHCGSKTFVHPIISLCLIGLGEEIVPDLPKGMRQAVAAGLVCSTTPARTRHLAMARAMR